MKFCNMWKFVCSAKVKITVIENRIEEVTRAVARAMKTRATARAERKKTQPDSTHRGIFFNGAGDGSNQRVRGPTRDVAPSSSQIKNLIARKCQKDLEDRTAVRIADIRCSVTTTTFTHPHIHK